MTTIFQSMFCVYDNKAEAYQSPFFAPTEGAAVRIIQDALRDPNTLLARHPADFNLFHVGGWNSSTAELVPIVPRNMGLLVDYLPKEATQLPLIDGVKKDGK